MATSDTLGSNLGGTLADFLTCDQIMPGDDPSYQTCKIIFLYHPLGAKIAEWPIKMAQSQRREISIPKGPEERLKEAFEAEWEDINADTQILNTLTLARVYGVASVVCGEGDNPKATKKPIDWTTIAGKSIYFNVLDPLNTAGSLVLDLNPNSPSFLKKTGPLVVNGQEYHPSRACIVFNEQPIYLAYTSSSYGYVGRSAYQRAFFPLKTFVQSMITDDLVTVKAGLLIAKMKQPGSVVNAIMGGAIALKRTFLQIARTGNVLSIGLDDSIEAVNLEHTHTAMETARKNVLDNIAVGTPMPAILLNAETFAQARGDGTEDARAVSQYIDGVRKEAKPIYNWFDRIVMRRAWNEEFYATIQTEWPDLYGGMDYVTAFRRWENSFTATWPSMLKPSDEELAKVHDVKLKALIAALEVLLPEIDPTSKALLIQSALDNMNAMKLLFTSELQIDMPALEDWLQEQAERAAAMPMPGEQAAAAPAEPKPFANAA